MMTTILTWIGGAVVVIAAIALVVGVVISAFFGALMLWNFRR